MTFTSHARNFEDAILWRALKDVERGFYVSVGAACPDPHSITRAYYELGWHGITLEADPQCLDERRRLRPRDVTLAGTAGHPDAAAGGPEPVTTLARIFADHLPDGQDIHFLVLADAGRETAVLSGNDWTKFRPWIIVIETAAPAGDTGNDADCQRLLTAAGYVPARRDGTSRFFIAREHAVFAALNRDPVDMSCDAPATTVEALKAEIAQLKRDHALELRRLELECCRAENELAHRLFNAESARRGRTYRWENRGPVGRLLFCRDGRPCTPLLHLLFRASGRPRSLARPILLRRNGTPRKRYDQWMRSPAYLALPEPYRI